MSNSDEPASTPPVENPFGDLVGLEFTDLEAGASTCELAVGDRHRNPYGTVHGGVLYTMADTGMGAALFAGLGPEEVCATIEIKMNHLQPVRTGRLVCETRVIERGSSVAHLESVVSNDGDVVARAVGTYHIGES